MSCKSKKPMSEAPATAKSLAFTEISKQTFSGLDKAENLYLDNTADWTEFWSRVHSNSTPNPDKPSIDFSKHIVLAVCMGTQNSGGYNTKIEEIKTDGETAYVSVINTSPGKGCMSTMAITYPYHIVQIEKGTLKQAVFSTEERVHDCN